MFHNNELWIRQEGNSDFDVTMEGYDDAEVCELVWLLMLNKLSKCLKKDSFGLQRDDRSTMFKNYHGYENKVRKEMIKVLNTNRCYYYCFHSKIVVKIIWITTFIVKMPCCTTTIFLGVYVTFVCSKPISKVSS